MAISKSVVALFLAAQISFSIAIPSTVPAFLWSPRFSTDGAKEAVNYQIISPEDLVKSVLSEGGWSNLLCPRERLQQPVDLALVFVGRELQSSDIAQNKLADPALLDMLKVSFTSSNFSMAFPYVAVSEDEAMEKLLVSGFREACGSGLEIGDIAFSESCLIEGGDAKKLKDFTAVHDHLLSRMEKRAKGHTDLVVLCHGGPNSLKELNRLHSESKSLSQVISAVMQSGAKYAALYVSDSYRSIYYPSYQELQRFLVESPAGNASANSTTCDEICLIKSSLLEGVFVGIVLLLILISGLCCMMGIDTPTRFEAPQES